MLKVKIQWFNFTENWMNMMGNQNVIFRRELTLSLMKLITIIGEEWEDL